MLIQRPDRNHMEVDVVKHVPAGFWVKTVNANDAHAGLAIGSISLAPLANMTGYAFNLLVFSNPNSAYRFDLHVGDCIISLDQFAWLNALQQAPGDTILLEAFGGEEVNIWGDVAPSRRVSSALLLDNHWYSVF